MVSKTTVLVLGQEAVLQAQLFVDLQHQLTLLQAADANQVIDITSDNERVDCIIVDIHSVNNGVDDFFKWLKTDNETRGIPLIVLGDEGDDINLWLQAGAVDFIFKSTPALVVAARVKVLREFTAKTQLLVEIASLDALTSVANRARLDEYLDVEWRRSLREYYPLSLIRIDMDSFSAFNDQFGIGAGDDMLKQVANVLDNLINRAGDMVSRYDGDEFYILLPGTELNNALLLATRMTESIALLGTTFGTVAEVGLLSASAGVATIEPSRDKHYRDLIDEAGDMLQNARQSGGGQVQGVSI